MKKVYNNPTIYVRHLALMKMIAGSPDGKTETVDGTGGNESGVGTDTNQEDPAKSSLGFDWSSEDDF